MLKLKTPVLWPPHAKCLLTGKDSDAGRDWGQEEKGTTGWDEWMASPTRWMWVWVNSGRWWWTGRPGVLQFMGSQRVRHDWATELNKISDMFLYNSQDSPMRKSPFYRWKNLSFGDDSCSHCLTEPVSYKTWIWGMMTCIYTYVKSHQDEYEKIIHFTQTDTSV